MSSEMPWREPFAFNLPQFDEVVENYKENPTPANTAAAVLAVSASLLPLCEITRA